jgi:cephalosporin hydroxylase
MKYIIDTEERTLSINDKNTSQQMSLYSDDAFHHLTHQWLKIGWNQKYPYTFTWMGRPIIQIPEDMFRLQEVLYQLKPDVILETGIAHGGSLVFYASLCKSIGKGRVIGIDIEIRPSNRLAIESHELFSYITLIEGSSVDPAIVAKVHSQIQKSETVIVILDSNHSKEHVLAELESYQSLIKSEYYLIVADGFMKELHDVPRGKQKWSVNNPLEAIKEFKMRHPDFYFERPSWQFNESTLSNNVTHWPGAWLKRRKH